MPTSVHSWDGKTTVSGGQRPSSASGPTLTNRRKSTVARCQSPRQEPLGEEAKKPGRAITIDHLTRSLSTMLIPERPIAEEPTFRESLWAIFCCSCMFRFCRASACGY